jgi:hypothetical protein
MAKFHHKAILTFRAHVAGDWRLDDPSMARAKLPAEIINGYEHPKEFIVYHKRKKVAVLDLGLEPGLESGSWLRDEKIRLTIVTTKSKISGKQSPLFDEEILYKETLAFAESILPEVDRILLEITAENQLVFEILNERGLLVLPDDEAIGKDAIYYPRKP